MPEGRIVCAFLLTNTKVAAQLHKNTVKESPDSLTVFCFFISKKTIANIKILTLERVFLISVYMISNTCYSKLFCDVSAVKIRDNEEEEGLFISLSLFLEVVDVVLIFPGLGENEYGFT